MSLKNHSTAFPLPFLFLCALLALGCGNRSENEAPDGGALCGSNECTAEQVCDATREVCVSPVGGSCEQAEDCESGVTCTANGLCTQLPTCEASLPSDPGSTFSVDVYAVFGDTSPGSISFADDGRLYVANVGELGVPSPEQNLPILRIDEAATTIDALGRVEDPDVVIVDVLGVIADEGNVLAGGLRGNPGGQRPIGRITELDAEPDTEGTEVATIESDPCIYNVSAMLFVADDSLLVGNFVQVDEGRDDVVPAVCKLTRVGEQVATETLIDPVDRAVSGLARAPEADASGSLFVSRIDQPASEAVERRDVVYRYAFDGSDETELTDGTLLAYGPSGTPFDGLIVLRADGELYVVDPDTGEPVRTLLTGVTDGTGTSGTLRTTDAGTVLYLSEWENRRILRVSETALPPTAIGCMQ